MNRPFDAASATSDNRITLSPEDELAVLRARVDELERESAERKRMDHALKALAFGTATATGQECLQQLVRQLSASLEVPCVFVTEFVPGSTDRVRTVAGWCQGKAADSVEYALQNSPCENVFRDGLVFLPRHVRQHFPQDEYLIALNIESYMGVPLLNGAGRATGHLCVMDVRPFGFDRGQGAAILSAFAERAAAELERLRAEETLKQSEERFRALYENNPTMYFTLTPDGTILSVNRFGAEELGYGSEELAGRSVLQVFQPADHHTVLNQLTLCAQNPGRTFDWEVQKVRKTGTLLWVKERARAAEEVADAGAVVLAGEVPEGDIDRRLRIVVAGEGPVHHRPDALDREGVEADESGRQLGDRSPRAERVLGLVDGAERDRLAEADEAGVGDELDDRGVHDGQVPGARGPVRAEIGRAHV